MKRIGSFKMIELYLSFMMVYLNYSTMLFVKEIKFVVLL